MDCSPPDSSVHGDFPDNNAEVGCHALLQEIFPMQGSNPDLPHCKWTLYHLSHQGSPWILEWVRFSSVQFNSATQSCPTLYDLMDCSMPGFQVHHQLPELTQTHVHRVGDAIQPSHPLLSCSPVFNLSQHQCLFKWVSSLHQVAKVLVFQLQLSPSNEYSAMISFRVDWFDLLAVQGTLKSLLQHHNLKASILWRSVFFRTNSHIHIRLLEKPYNNSWWIWQFIILFLQFLCTLDIFPSTKPEGGLPWWSNG